MKKLRDFKLLPLTRDQLTKINGGVTPSSGECDNFISMPEPGRYCLYDPE